MKTEKEQIRFMSGNDEVELTNALIKEIVANGLWADEYSLKQLRRYGAKWSTRRNTLVLDDED